MKSTKALALVMAIFMIVPLLFSCAGTGDTANTRGDSQGEADIGDFVSGDYKNEPFTILFLRQKAGDKDYYGGNYLDSDGLTGATIEDTVYKRNMAVEEKYRVVIEQKIEEMGQPADIAKNYYMAGDFCFDLIYGWGAKMGPCIIENYFADLMDVPYIDLEQEYWCPSAIDELTINDSVYVWINDISMNKLEWAYFLFLNKQVYEDYNVESICGSPYELVKEGKWTIDRYLKMVTGVSNDIDGDGQITKDDVYGMIGMSPTDLACASGITITKKADDGSYLLSYYDAKTVDLANKIKDVHENNRYNKGLDEIWEDADITGYNDQWEYSRSFFARDHALFLNGSAYITTELRNMKSEYGILPFPKYDENQENYIHTVSSPSSIFGLPSTYRTDISTASPERTGMILEYMAYKSNEMLLPKYYDTLLKGQRLNSEDDQQMLDIIRTTIRYEFAEIMGLEDIFDNFYNVMTKPQTASSTYGRHAKKLQKQLDEFYKDVLLLGTK